MASNVAEIRWTTALHGQCADGYLQDIGGEITCSVCGTEDVPTWQEIRANLDPSDVLDYSGNGVLRPAPADAFGIVSPVVFHHFAGIVRETLHNVDALSPLPAATSLALSGARC